MATKVKPSRLQVTWTPQAWNVPVYVNDDCFQRWSGWWGWWGGAEWWNITGTLCNQIDLQVALNCKLNASALSDTNYWWAWNGDTTHTPTKNAIYTKLHTMDVEIWNKAADNTVVKLSWNQVVWWTKTFCISPVVPSKCAAAVNCDTAIATEAQVYNVAQAIPTDNCQLANWCGYTTCTGTLVASDIQCLAQCCDIPTDNCQLSNGCWYTTCTGTLVAGDLACYACCCDIPTDNCQLANGCGYTTCTWTISDCAWIVSALGYTPYSNANPCGYTTCTGTLVAGDIAWLVAESCIACINWCCLTQWGNICIQWGGGGGWIQLAPNSEYNVAYHWYWPQSCYDTLSQYYTCCACDTAYFTTDE